MKPMIKNDMDKLAMKIHSYLSGFLEDEKFSGAILVSVQGETIISKGYGMANYELGVLNKPETKFRIGSITKQFTAATILQLCEKGLININDTLDKYITSYPNGKNVTIHQLLTHSSGIPEHTNVKEFMLNVRNKHSVEELIHGFKDRPYDFKPGSEFAYCNSGYILLGYIIEKVTKDSYEKYLNKNIFKKFTMDNSGYDDYKKIIKNRASGYNLQGEERKLVNCDFIDMSIPYAAGGLYSTVEDLHIWNNKLTKGQILSEHYLNEMFTKQVKTKNSYYGYGLYIQDVEVHGQVKRKLWHRGEVQGFFSCNTIFPHEDIQITMISNIYDKGFFNKVSHVESIVLEGVFR